MDIPNHAELLARIELFCLRHEMAETRFGREAVSNPNFISGLRREPPVSPTLKTLNEVQDFMARIDADQALRAKLAAPLEPSETPPATEEDTQLPFGAAPVNRTGASSPTSSPTSAPRQSLEANGSCPLCSPDESPLAVPSAPTVDGLAA